MGRKCVLAVACLLPLGLFPFLRDNGTNNDVADKPLPPPAMTPDQRLVLACLTVLPGQSFPAAIPWEPFRHVGQQESRALEELAKKDPIEFLQRGLNRYEKEVQGYNCIFDKREKVAGELGGKEKIRVHFRAKPFSVHMEWIAGKSKAIRTLYVENEHDGLLVVRALHPLMPLMKKKVDAPDVKGTSRFPITSFGVYNGAKDTLHHMREAKKNNTLHVRYEGVVPVAELGNRLCYKLVRTPYEPPEGDGCNDLTIYIDLETQMQTGSVLKDSEGNLIAEYFFRNIEPNPTHSEKQFTERAL